MIVKEKDNVLYYNIETSDKVQFKGKRLKNQYVVKSFQFAMDMTFNFKGEHREYRTGGVKFRKNGEIFSNAFQGKLAEFGVYDMLKNRFKLKPTYPDLETYGKGSWDISDIKLEENNLLVSIKSTKGIGNLLLLESGDYDLEGNYIPNKELCKNNYNIVYMLVRIATRNVGESVSDILKDKDLLYKDNLLDNQINAIEKDILNISWYYDVPGYIPKSKLKNTISDTKNKKAKGHGIKSGFIPQGAKLNNYINMDADNYFFVSTSLIKPQKNK